MDISLEIIPGILEKEWSGIEKKIESSRSFAKTLHIDIIDGEFVNNTTFIDPSPFIKYSTDFFLELHMMVNNPIQYVETFAKAGFKRFLGHIEMMPDQNEFLVHAKKFGEAGLAIDGPTELHEIKVPFTQPDIFLLYTSQQVGFSGPPFLPERVEKIKSLRSQTTTSIEVDGGITNDTLFVAKEAGANKFVSTSFIFSSNHSAQEQFNKLKSSL
jgi:ribulose-phosphate 3-epimerase